MANDILVLADHLKGQLSDATQELVGKAKELAGATGGQAVVALLGAPEIPNVRYTFGLTLSPDLPT